MVATAVTTMFTVIFITVSRCVLSIAIVILAVLIATLAQVSFFYIYIVIAVNKTVTLFASDEVVVVTILTHCDVIVTAHIVTNNSVFTRFALSRAILTVCLVVEHDSIVRFYWCVT
jgi:hypothetical protein